MLRRTGIASVLATVAGIALGTISSPASAAVTIGQLGPASPPATCFGGGNTDLVQPTVVGGNSYVVPTAGTITSWSTSAAAGAGQTFAMKVWRRVTGLTYMALAHEGPHPLTGGFVNTFPSSVPVNPGDVLGANRGPGASNCVFAAAPGETFLLFGGDLADGDSDVFTLDTGGFRVNISALLESDADHDGFGDETQDQCPTDASTQGTCPAAPVTAVTTVKKKKCTKHKKHRSAESAKKKKCKKKKHG